MSDIGRNDNPSGKQHPKVIIIADDLTGALDAAGPFACRGLKTIFVPEIAQLEEALHQAPEILAVNTRSREVPPDEAMHRVREFAHLLPESTYLFKKIDSRLKGNIEAELSAVSFKKALVVPAIPKFRRIARDNQITGFGIDTPISIEHYLGQFTTCSEIPDTLNDNDIHDALTRYGNCDLLIGARGLAEALAQRISGIDMPQKPPALGTSMLIAVGSRDPITLAQLAALRSNIPGIIDIAAPNGSADLTHTAIDKEHLILVQATPGKTIQSGAEVEQKLAETICIPQVLDRSVLVLTGGATAEVVLKQMKAGVMRIVGEALPGLPIARTGNLTVITKSGGFGTTDTLIQLFKQISCPQ